MTILDKNVIFGLKMAFFGSNEPFLRPTRTFLDRKMAVCSKICLFSEENYQERPGEGKNWPFLRPMSTSWEKKRAFQANIANMEQKCHGISLFWPEMIIFWTSEGCSGPKMTILDKNVIFGLKKDLFWG
jgi:hypothetical protein